MARHRLQFVIDSLKKIRKHLCCYKADHGKLCDCKYGASEAGVVGKDGLGRIGEESGCPELYEAIEYLEALKKTAPLL